MFEPNERNALKKIEQYIVFPLTCTSSLRFILLKDGSMRETSLFGEPNKGTLWEETLKDKEALVCSLLTFGEDEEEEDDDGGRREVTVRRKIPSLFCFCANETTCCTSEVFTIFTRSPSSSVYFTTTSQPYSFFIFSVKDSSVSLMVNSSLQISSPWISFTVTEEEEEEREESFLESDF